MSDLTERMRRLADQSAEYWADIIGSIVAGSTAPGGSSLAARIEHLLREAADRIEQLETAEFIGRLPDYVKELEAENERLAERIESLEAANARWLEKWDRMECEWCGHKQNGESVRQASDQ